MDQHRLDRIADRGTLRFAVVDDVDRHFKVGRRIDENMTVADARPDNRHRRILRDCRDQSGAAARDQHIEILRELHELIRGFAGGVRHELDDIRRQPCRLHRIAHDIRQADIRAECLLAAAQDHAVSGFHAERRRIDRDIRAALEDDADDAERHARFLNAQTVRADISRLHSADDLLKLD